MASAQEGGPVRADTGAPPGSASGVREPDHASVLIVNDAGEYLLHLRDHRPGIWEPGSWSLLGGGREPGDRSLEETARRELQEEAGLDLPVLEPLQVEHARRIDGAMVTIQIYVARWNGDPESLHLTEGVMLRWFAPEVVPRLRMSPSTLDLVRDHAARPPSGPRGAAAAAPHLPGARRQAPAPDTGQQAVPNVIGVHLHLENAQGEVLLGLRHPDSAYAGNTWHFLAGHCEQESAVSCLVREALEEAGLVIAPADVEFVHAVHLVHTPGGRPRMQLVFRARRWEGTPELREPDKCLAWQWWRPDALPEPLVPYARAAIDGIRAGRLYTEMGWGAR
ncbi:NUDIX hydrolase [Streptomyces sp. NPDC001222]|uniref:NUDIX hydrolase n=1 Tax=Streptomyces sp. NPDC001222 TaxID=3364548 RepID=UPI0036D1F702